MANNPRGFPVNGAAIAGFRRLLKMTQAALAAEADISYQYVSQLERGARTSATVEVIEAIASALRQDKRAIMATPFAASGEDDDEDAA